MTDNVLKPYLLDNLPEKFVLNDGEIIADALVIVRIVDLGTDDVWIPERLEYTSSAGCSFNMARGMLLGIQDELRAVHLGNLAHDEDD